MTLAVVSEIGFGDFERASCAKMASAAQKPGPEQAIPENYQPCPASSPDLRVGQRHIIEPLTAPGVTVTNGFFLICAPAEYPK
jgi:hypothetical protein